MPLALEVIHGLILNPGATITATAPATGDSFAVRNFEQGANAYLIGMWASSATAGVARVRSPRLHDNQQGYRSRVPATNSDPLWALGAKQKLYAQDTLILEQSGGGAETDGMALLIAYEDLPGSNARLVGWDQVKDRIEQMVTIETAHSTGATLASYGSSIALNAGVADLLIANRDYAVIGYEVDVRVTSYGLRGPDIGNYRVGGPATVARQFTNTWFKDQSLATGMPLIPIINSANKAGTFVDLVHNLAGVAVNVNTILALLRQS